VGHLVQVAIREAISPFLPAGFESNLSIELGEVVEVDPFFYAQRGHLVWTRSR